MLNDIVHFYVRAWEVLLWEVMIALNTGCVLWILYKMKKKEFSL